MKPEPAIPILLRTCHADIRVTRGAKPTAAFSPGAASARFAKNLLERATRRGWFGALNAPVLRRRVGIGATLQYRVNNLFLNINPRLEAHLHSQPVTPLHTQQEYVVSPRLSLAVMRWENSLARTPQTGAEPTQPTPFLRLRELPGVVSNKAFSLGQSAVQPGYAQAAELIVAQKKRIETAPDQTSSVPAVAVRAAGRVFRRTEAPAPDEAVITRLVQQKVQEQFTEPNNAPAWQGLPQAQVNINLLADQVIRQIDQRIVAQRERLGKGVSMALEKAVIANTVTGERIPVMFNPEEYTLSKENNFAQVAVPGLSGPLLQFINGNMSTLEMELLVDTYEQHREGSRSLNQAGDDVRIFTRKVTDLMVINPATHAPPVLIFTPVVSLSFAGATMHSFTCVLARVTQRMIMFLPDGTPVRARLQVSFHEFINAELEAKEVKRETVDYSKIYTVSQGESLSAIAARAYGNPRLWRAIALRNHIDNPCKLSVGGQLIVPHLPYRDPETGEVYS